MFLNFLTRKGKVDRILLRKIRIERIENTVPDGESNFGHLDRKSSLAHIATRAYV